MRPEYAQMLRKYPFNRVSMGIQSFNDSDLRFLRRRHDASQAVNAIEILNGVGFNNISIDLIYGLPGQTLEAWSDNLDKAFKLNITHLSAYHLIYEEGTTMYKLMQSGKIIPVNEDLSLEMFKMLIEKAGKNNLLQYEISNFAKKGLESRHNSSYWDNQKYIGFGPGAHSYDGEKREYNISDLKVYLNDEEYYDTEVLSDTDKYNELILTSIRTMKGLDLNLLKSRFPDKYEYCISMTEKSIEKKLLKIESERLSLTTEGIFLSDSIMSDLIFID